jgi:DNA-binding transcriptional MocR family regulator
MDVSEAISGWSIGRGPLYARLAEALRDTIRRGDVRQGVRLPSERDLARSLAISRTTVAAAYGLLRDEGVLLSRRGSGTRVAGFPSSGPLWSAVTSAERPSFELPMGAPGEIIDSSSAVIRGLDDLPAGVLQLMGDEVRQLAEGFGYEPLGLPGLRVAIAERYGRLGLATTPDEVLVTTGAQQAIDLLFALFGRDHGTIVTENPTYYGALDVARTRGVTLIGVPIDEDGIQADLLREVVARSPVRLAYLMPSCHNPTGAVMGSERRREIARLADETAIPVVDDATLTDLSLDTDQPPPLAAFAKTGTIITIGSLSKLFWVGLRIGWIRAPAPLIGRLARLKIVTDLGSPHISQLLAARLVGLSDAMRATRRRQLLGRLDLLEAQLQERLPAWSWSRPQGGPFLWVRLPQADAGAFAQRCLRHGVRVVPGRKMSTDESFGDHLRLSFVAEPEEIRAAVDRLAGAWHAFASMGAGRTAVEVIV